MDYHITYANNPCPYENYNTLSYMDSLDLSDILDYEDYMVTSSDVELQGMEEVPYWQWTLVCLNTYLKILVLTHYVLSFQEKCRVFNFYFAKTPP